MDLIESLGAYLGLAAFVGLAVLVLLYFQQARDVRRLREWAGRAPERAAGAAERSEAEGTEEEAAGPGRLAELRSAIEARAGSAGEALARRYRAVDRRSPIDLRYALGILAAVGLAAAALTTDGFGVLGDDRSEGDRAATPAAQVKVAVLNGTGVQGLAATAGEDVKAAGYKLGVVTNTESAFGRTVIMSEPGHTSEAKRLADQLRNSLGRTPVEPVTDEIRERARGAEIALVLGVDDAQL